MTTPTPTTSGSAARPHALRRLYDWVLHWAHTPYGMPAIFLIALIEASVFPIPPDVLLMALVIGRPPQWVRYAAVCTLGSVIGALLGYGIGFAFWHAVDQFFLTYVFSPDVFQLVVGKYEQAAFLTVFTAAFTPIPFKVITIAAGVAEIPIPDLVAGSVLGRAMRFFIVAGLLYRFGPPIRNFIDRYFGLLTIVFTLLLIGGFLAVKYLLQ